MGLGYSCGKFDPLAAITNTLNDIGAGVDNLMNAMAAAATSAIASLPGLILQRANPGLYDLFQNALIKAEATLELATKSCEQMEAAIAEGKNPYADLIVLSKGNDWKMQMCVGGNDAVTAKSSVESANGDNGVPWIGGQASGSGQPEMEFTGDIVAAGYNINMNRAVSDTSTIPTASMSRLSDIWPSPAIARHWTVDVVGDNIVTTCDTCRKDSIPGTGLLPKLYQESTAVTTDIQNLVSGGTPPSLTNLDKISAPGVAITRQVIEAIRDMPADYWGTIACHSGDMGFDRCYLPEMPGVLMKLSEHQNSVSGFMDKFKAGRKVNDLHTMMMLAMAATYDPDPEAPWGIQLPVTIDTREVITERWDQWLKWDPVLMIEREDVQASLKSLKVVYIDCGLKDQYKLLFGARQLVKRLDELDIDHRYEEFSDSHSSVDYRLDISLPFLYEKLGRDNGV